MRILIVEDDPNLGGFLIQALEEATYSADRAGSLADARLRLAERTYDLLSLDVNLPDGSGLDLLGEVRGGGRSFPVLVLSSRATVAERVAGLDRGADDYLAKPFSLDEFLSRIRALLRRGAGRADPMLRLGALECDEAAHRVSVAGRPVELTPKEFAVVRLFLRSPGTALSRSQVVNAVWNWAFEGYSNVVDVHISALRRKLRGSGVRFRSIPKVGYVLEEVPDARGDAGAEEDDGAPGGAEKSGAEKSGAERSGAEKSGAERSRAEKSGAEKKGVEGEPPRRGAPGRRGRKSTPDGGE